MIAELIAAHVEDLEESLIQLVRLMLFNAAINNTDDHERNFSLLHRQGRYQLSPAYDLIPSLTAGGYHSAGYQYAVTPPRPSEAVRLGKIFGLSKPMVAEIAEQIIDTVSQWEGFAEAAGVSELDASRIAKVLHP